MVAIIPQSSRVLRSRHKRSWRVSLPLRGAVGSLQMQVNGIFRAIATIEDVILELSQLVYLRPRLLQL
jgi:hypothetical protein